MIWRSACLLVLLPISAIAGDLPDAAITPGAARPGITAAELCPVSHTAQLRNVPRAQKIAVYRAYGMSGPRTGRCAAAQGCEIDHLISLEIGGSNEPSNLWPQNYSGTPWNAHAKDRLENRLHSEICAGTITIKKAQHDIATDWIAAYRAAGLPLPEGTN